MQEKVQEKVQSLLSLLEERVSVLGVRDHQPVGTNKELGAVRQARQQEHSEKWSAGQLAG